MCKSQVWNLICRTPFLGHKKVWNLKKVKENIAKEEEDSPKDLIHKEKLAKKDKDKSEECSEIDEKKSDDETVKLFLRKISTGKITFDIEYLQVNRDCKKIFHPAGRRL